MNYQFIEQHKQKFPVVVMCRVLAVSESGFYAWRKCPACRRKREDAQLSYHMQQVFRTHRERYAHAMRNEVVEELNLIGGAKVVQNWTVTP